MLLTTDYLFAALSSFSLPASANDSPSLVILFVKVFTLPM